jgi:hypothetical protein
MYIIKNQSGFAHVTLVLAVLAVSSIAFVGGMVYNAEQKKNEVNQTARIDGTNQIDGLIADQKAQSTEDVEKIEVPAEEKPTEVVKPPADEPKTVEKPKTTTTEKQKTEIKQISITSTSFSVTGDNVVLTAQLPDTYQGKCKALVKYPDGNNAQWHKATFGPAKNCSITVPKSKLASTDTWQFYMYFYTSDDTVKGSSGSKSFTL